MMNPVTFAEEQVSPRSQAEHALVSTRGSNEKHITYLGSQECTAHIWNKEMRRGTKSGPGVTHVAITVKVYHLRTRPSAPMHKCWIPYSHAECCL